METDYTVKVNYVNSQTGERSQRVYPFVGYMNNMAFELKQVLYEVENVFFQLENHRDRAEWSEESEVAFGKIRKKLLNSINSIQRLPDTLCYKGVSCNSIPASEMLAKIIDNK